MGLAAMARITKVPEERLVELAASNPVFAPGPENYLRMGGVQEIWSGNLAEQLQEALRLEPVGDDRAALGFARGGRKLAEPVVAAILAGSDVFAP
jgi:malonate decarboxylase gamma subunit